MIDVSDIAFRLDAEEKLKLTYRFPVRTADGQLDHQVREGKILDVSEEADLLYVSHNKEVIWVKPEEVVDVAPDDD